jgi:hypothetical protein
MKFRYALVLMLLTGLAVAAPPKILRDPKSQALLAAEDTGASRRPTHE